MSGKTKSTNKKQKSFLGKNIILRLSVVLFIHILTVLLTCTFFYATDKDVYDGYPITMIALTVAGFISAYFIGKKIRKNGMVLGIAYNLPITAVYIIISLIASKFQFDSRIFLLPVIQIIISAIGGITAVNSKSKNKRSR